MNIKTVCMMNEREFNNYLHKLHLSSESSLKNIQYGFAPHIVPLKPIHRKRYTMYDLEYERYGVYRLYECENFLIKREELNGGLSLDYINKSIINCFLLFLDDKLYPLSNIYVKADDREIHLLTKDIIFTKNAKLVIFPFECYYTEVYNEIINSEFITFTQDMIYDGIRKSIKIAAKNPDKYILQTIYVPSQEINGEKVYEENAINYNKLIKKKEYKLFQDNFLFFKNGKLITNLKYKDLPLNYFQYESGTIPDKIFMVYYKFQFENFDISDKLLHRNSWIEKYLNGEEVPPVFKKLIENPSVFEMNFNGNPLKNIIGYDVTILGRIDTIEELKTGAELIRDSKDGGKTIRMSLYRNGNLNNRPIIYNNGYLLENYNELIYDNNEVVIPLDKIKPSDKLSFVWYGDIDNTVSKINIHSDYITDYLQQDAIIFSNDIDYHEYNIPFDENLYYEVPFRYKYTNHCVYCGDGSTLKKLTSKGEPIWEYNGHTSEVLTITTDYDNNVYTASMDGTILKINKDGILIWKYSSDSGKNYHFRFLATDSKGNLYAGKNRGQVIKLNSLGYPLWEVSYANNVCGLDVDSKDCVIISTESDSIIKTDADGNELWKYYTNDRVTALYIDKNDNILAGNTDGVLYKLSSDGEIMWNYTGSNSKINSIVIDRFNNIYIANDTYKLHKLEDNGTLIWQFENPNFRPYKQLLIAPDNRVYARDAYSLQLLYTYGPEVIWNYDSDNYLFSIGYDRRNGVGIDFIDDYYYNRDLVAVSANQFRHMSFKFTPDRKDITKIPLTDEFKFCNDKERYVVFINNKRVLNFYLFTNNFENKLNERFIELGYVLDVGKEYKIDIFYTSQKEDTVHQVDQIPLSGFIQDLPEPYLKPLHNMYINGKRIYSDDIMPLDLDSLLLTNENITSDKNMYITRYTEFDISCIFETIKKYFSPDPPLPGEEDKRPEIDKLIDDLEDDDNVDDIDDEDEDIDPKEKEDEEPNPRPKEDIIYDHIFEKVYPLDASKLYNYQYDKDLLPQYLIPNLIKSDKFYLEKFGYAEEEVRRIIGKDKNHIEVYQTSYDGYIKVHIGNYKDLDPTKLYSISIRAIINSNISNKIYLEYKLKDGTYILARPLTRKYENYLEVDEEWYTFRLNNIAIIEDTEELNIMFLIPREDHGIIFKDCVLEDHPYSSDKINLIIVNSSIKVREEIAIYM